jgi:hypothetical protein
MAILKEELTVEKTTSVSEVENAGTMPLKTNGHGIALVPQPSDDPLDPLVSRSHLRSRMRLIMLW